MAKPWATSHVATVAAGLGIEHRISGDVKEKLVSLLEGQLMDICREMEDKTLEADPERKLSVILSEHDSDSIVPVV